MAAIVQQDDLGIHRACPGDGRRGWNRIVTTVDEEHRETQRPQLTEKIVIRPEAIPDLLLNAACHAEWSKVARSSRVGKVSRDGELEGALLVLLGVRCAEI